MLRDLLTNWCAGGYPLPGLRLWLRLRWLFFILLGLISIGYAFSLVRGVETVSRAGFYWFFYSGALLIMGGLVEQGHNLERN